MITIVSPGLTQRNAGVDGCANLFFGLMDFLGHRQHLG